MGALRAAHRGAVAAPTRPLQAAPERFQVELARQRRLRHPPRGPPPETGDVPNAPRSIDWQALRRRPVVSGPHRVRTLGLFVGGGGSRLGLDDRLFEHAAAVELDGPTADVYAANFDDKLLRLDLTDWRAAMDVLRRHGPYDFCQASTPCPDFSRSGKGVEGPRARLTVSTTRLLIGLRVPVIAYENVPRMLASKAWAESRALLVDAGYATRAVEVDAADCGVPQHRKRVFVMALRGVGVADAERRLDRWAQRVSGRVFEGRSARRSVADALPGIKTFFLYPRNGTSPGVLSARGLAPTLRTNCSVFPRLEAVAGRARRWWRRRPGDAGPIEEATRLSPSQRGVIAGFPPDFLWPESNSLAAKVQGNSVAPAVMRMVVSEAAAAGVFQSRRGGTAAASAPVRVPPRTEKRAAAAMAAGSVPGRTPEGVLFHTAETVSVVCRRGV